jgi:hypothetical protein
MDDPNGTEKVATDKTSPSNCELVLEEPDWDVLAEYEPSRQGVVSFLDARDKLSIQMDHVEQTLVDIHTGLVKGMNELVQVTLNKCDSLEEDCVGLEDKIESKIIANYERRQQFRARVQQVAQRLQGIFSNFLRMV